MSSHANGCVLLGIAASTLAFRAGQLVEELLLERSLEVAQEADARVVTPDHVESCLDESLLSQLRERLRERFHDGQPERDRKKVA